MKISSLLSNTLCLRDPLRQFHILAMNSGNSNVLWKSSSFDLPRVIRVLLLLKILVLLLLFLPKKHVPFFLLSMGTWHLCCSSICVCYGFFVDLHACIYVSFCIVFLNQEFDFSFADAKKQFQAFASQTIASRFSSTIQSAFSVVWREISRKRDKRWLPNIVPICSALVNFLPCNIINVVIRILVVVTHRRCSMQLDLWCKWPQASTWIRIMGHSIYSHTLLKFIHFVTLRYIFWHIYRDYLLLLSCG